MHRNGLAVVALVAAVGAAGCLVKETTHRLYLSPSGAVGWAVLEESVRSTENDPAKRMSEEQEWLAAVARDTHAVAEGLRRLGTDQATTTLLRPARPYMALTDARFDRVDRRHRAPVRRAGAAGRSDADGRRAGDDAVGCARPREPGQSRRRTRVAGHGAARGRGPLSPRADRRPIRVGHRLSHSSTTEPPLSFRSSRPRSPGSSWGGQPEAHVVDDAGPKATGAATRARDCRPRLKTRTED